LEEHYDIKLGNIARAFNVLRTRQNPAQYIDLMKEAVLKRMEEAENRTNAYYTGKSSFSKPVK
jgi:hypothetical protein